MAGKYHQGKYTVKNPEKYVGDANNVIYRSSWECKFFVFCDTHPSVIKWASESIIIPYISPKDGRPHRYFVDMMMIYKTKTGEIKKALIEIKPKVQMSPPVKKAKVTRRYLQEVETYAVNTAKWKAAKQWADKNGVEFKILNEHDLGIK